MATNSSLKEQLNKKRASRTLVVKDNFKETLKSKEVKKKFKDNFGDKSTYYVNNILKTVDNQENIRNCEPKKVVDYFILASQLNLPVDKALGYSWIEADNNRAKFNLGYKGYIQLALNTGNYKSMNIIEVHEGELIRLNPLTEKIRIDLASKKSEAIVGYAAHFETKNGFKKSVYISKDDMKNIYNMEEDNDLYKKLIIKDMLLTWGIIDENLQKACLEDCN